MLLIASNLFTFLAMKVYVILHRNFGKLNLVLKKVEKGIHSPNLRFTKPNNTEVSAQGVHCIFIIAAHRLNANFMEYFLSFLYSICCSAVLKKIINWRWLRCCCFHFLWISRLLHKIGLIWIEYSFFIISAHVLVGEKLYEPQSSSLSGAFYDNLECKQKRFGKLSNAGENELIWGAIKAWQKRVLINFKGLGSVH